MTSDGPDGGESPIAGDVLAGTTVAPDGVSLTVEAGSGARVTSVEGEEFVDYKLGSGPMLVGHAHPHVVGAMHDRIEDGTTFYAPNPAAHDFAERLVEAAPCGESIRFVSTGTEATYLAIRLARADTGNDRLLTFEGSYHGWHDEALVGSQRAGERLLDTSRTVDTAGAAPGVTDTVVKAPFNDLDGAARTIDAHADDLACVLVEPMMRSIPPADGFLAGLRDRCDEHGIVLVFDEVVTGFRLAWGGGQERYGVVPDLATYGKVIGGGTPVGAVCGDASILAATRPDRPPEAGGVATGGTLNGNPLGMVAGSATLDVLERGGTYSDLYDYGGRLRALFEDVLADSSLSGVTVGEGPVVDYAIADADEITDWSAMLACDDGTKAEIDRELFDRGILKSIGGKMYLSTEHGRAEFEHTAEAFKHAVARVDG
ncbi:MAG: aspartate aminotransferase family protein [Haloferacaceae archaeon]